MREILFRGKRVDNGEWIHGFLVIYGDDYYIALDINAYTSMGGRGKGRCMLFGHYYQVISETAGQYTGLTDKNGKNIFGGDIVHFRTSGLSGYGEVKEDNGRFVIVDKRKKPTRYYPFYDDAIYRVDGNIHDNPELLEVTE